jgi:hypothetical protein
MFEKEKTFCYIFSVVSLITLGFLLGIAFVEEDKFLIGISVFSVVTYYCLFLSLIVREANKRFNILKS